jgi:hypothetical protein
MRGPMTHEGFVLAVSQIIERAILLTSLSHNECKRYCHGILTLAAVVPLLPS